MPAGPIWLHPEAIRETRAAREWYSAWEETRVAAQKLGVQFQPLEARNPREIGHRFDAAAVERAAGLIVFDDPVIWSHRKQVLALAAKRRLPVMYGYREFVDNGGLMSYGPDRVDHYRRTALYVDKILRGTKPADLPVERLGCRLRNHG